MKKPALEHVETYTLLILAAGALIALFGAFIEQAVLFGAGMVILLGSIVFKLTFFRCPYCGGYLDRSTGAFCQHCGKQIREHK